MWCAIISQTDSEFGIALYDNCSDNGLSMLIDTLIRPYKHRVTLIKGRVRAPQTECLFKTVRNTIANPSATVLWLDEGETLVGRDTITNLRK